ncbi:MAG: NAD-binding protein [Myxococcales bacterium]|nr:NAD-binding protein [Myxococcales bacterium]
MRLSPLELAHQLSHLGARLRAVGLAAVPLLAVGAFASGVSTTGLPDLAHEPWWAWLYYAGGLFVYGGLDMGLPVGGHPLARMALWVAFFVAPAITTTALIDAALKVLRPKGIAPNKLRGHAVIAGFRQVGQTYLQAIRAIDTNLHVLLVDDHLTIDQHHEHDVSLIRADVREPGTLAKVALDEAALLVVAVEDDLAGLEMAWAAQAQRADLPVAVHVADLSLLRPVSRLIRKRAKQLGPDTLHPLVFNAHRIGALHVYEQYLHPHFEDTGYKDVVVIGGFGQFAQTIVELLRVMAADELDRVVIVDPDATRKVRQVAVDVALDSIEHVAVDGDLMDPGTWTKVSAAVADLEAVPIFLLSAEDELVNYRVAMQLRAKSKQPRIFARCFRRTAFAESLSDQLAFELLPLEDVLRDGLEDHYRAILTVSSGSQ